MSPYSQTTHERVTYCNGFAPDFVRQHWGPICGVWLIYNLNSLWMEMRQLLTIAFEKRVMAQVSPRVQSNMIYLSLDYLMKTVVLSLSLSVKTHGIDEGCGIVHTRVRQHPLRAYSAHQCMCDKRHEATSINLYGWLGAHMRLDSFDIFVFWQWYIGVSLQRVHGSSAEHCICVRTSWNDEKKEGGWTPKIRITL